MTSIVDLRSDTVTRPSAGMRRAMMDAELGDDVFGDDPTVNRLQAHAAESFGFEAALFFPSGTQSNLAALISHCQRGEGVIIGAEQHSYRYEAGGLGVLGSIHPQVIPNRADGTLDLAQIEATISPDDPHFPRTRLLALENTIGGKPIARAYLADAVQLARRRGLNIHLDGARIFNAAAHFKTSVRELCTGFDSVSSCLSKGLGAPAGTVLVGGRDFIARAKRARKILGGAMRQAGVVAAAGLYALEHNVERLAKDHANAARLAEGLKALDLPVEQHTNMVFATVPAAQAATLAEHLKQRNVLVLPGARMRLVTHLDVDEAGIDRALGAFGEFFGDKRARKTG
jgi:threonine aldolase